MFITGAMLRNATKSVRAMEDRRWTCGMLPKTRSRAPGTADISEGGALLSEAEATAYGVPPLGGHHLKIRRQNESSKQASAGTIVSQFRNERFPLRIRIT